jgi:hypothetical protein
LKRVPGSSGTRFFSVSTTLLRGLVLLLTMPLAMWGADVSSSGNWTETIDAGDLVAGAGSNVVGQHDSSSGVATLTISNTAGASWRILARRSDGTWHDSFALFVRRTSDGSGSGAVTGGGSYVELSTLDTELFAGSGDRSNMAVQYRLTGISKAVAPDLYSSGVIFTLQLQ